MHRSSLARVVRASAQSCISARLAPNERAAINDFLACAVVAGPETVKAGLATMALATEADEFMLVCDVFDPLLRLRSLDIAAACHSIEALG